MKKGIHPNYKPLKVVMTDGTTYVTKSTYGPDEIVLLVDSKSHPAYTGKRRMIDTAGRVDKFQKRFGIKAAANTASNA